MTDINFLHAIPEGYVIGRAIADGNCFFDSFRQGLRQVKKKVIRIQDLRKCCCAYARRNEHDDWFIINIGKRHDNDGTMYSETPEEYARNILESDRWGDPEVEGRILCKKFNVQLHVIEKLQEIWGHQIIDSSGCRSVGHRNATFLYNEPNTIHIINKGNNHFDPVLKDVNLYSNNDIMLPTEEVSRLHSANVSHDPRETSSDTRFEDKTNLTCTNERENNLSTFPPLKSRVLQGLPGNSYHLKLMMLFLIHGILKQYNFRLLAEVEEAKKFDDLVFEITDDQNRISYRLLQAKHKEDESQKMITFDQLFTDSDSDFSIVKYFFSYQGAKKEMIKKNSNAQQMIADATVCTNINVDLKDERLATVLEKVTQPDDILDVNTDNLNKQPVRYHFNGKAIESLKPMLLEYNLTRLARRLAKCVIENKPINHKAKTDIFKDYHGILAKEVIDTKHETFFENFVEDSPNSTLEESKKFRKIFDEEIKRKSNRILCLGQINAEIVKSKIKLNLSEDFGNDRGKEIKNANAEYEVLAKELMKCILSGKTINHKKRPFYYHHVMLAKEVVDIDNKRFRVEFVKGESWSEIRVHLEKESVEQAKLTLEDVNQALEDKSSRHVGLVLSKNFGKGDAISWPDNSITDEEIRDFLEHFVLAANQPNEEELTEVLQSELAKNFDIDTREIVYSKLFERLFQFLIDKDKEKFISHQEGREFFEKSRLGKSVMFDVRDPVENFTGRESKLKHLHELLQDESNKHGTVTSRTVYVVGLGGIGKTELVRQYIKQYSSCYDNNIVWIDATNEDTLTISFNRLVVEKLGIRVKNAYEQERSTESIIDDAYRFFSRKKCLFVFDNAKKYRTSGSNIEKDPGIDKFLPQALQLCKYDNIHFLVTSRNQQWGNLKAGLTLGALEIDEAVNLIKTSLKLDNNVEIKDAQELANTLECFPLALQQSVAYIRTKCELLKIIGKTFTIKRYIRKFEEKKEELLDFEFPEDSSVSYEKTTLTTWNITLEAIRVHKYGAHALEIMEILAYIDYDSKHIPVSLFSNILDNDEELAEVLWIPQKYSMFVVKDETISIHELVQYAIRENIERNGRTEAILDKALSVIGRMEDVRATLPHAAALLNHKIHGKKLANEHALLASSIMSHAYLRQYEVMASTLAKLILELTEESTEHIMDKAYCSFIQGVSLCMLRCFDVAFKKFEEVINLEPDGTALKRHAILMYISVPVCDKANIALQSLKGQQFLNSEALYPSNNGFYYTGCCEFSGVMIISESKRNAWKLDILNALKCVGVSLYKFETPAEQYKLLEDLVEFRLPVVPANHTEILFIRTRQARILWRQFKFKDALEIYENVAENLPKYFSPENPFVLEVKRNMCWIKIIQGKRGALKELRFEIFPKLIKIRCSSDQHTEETLRNLVGDWINVDSLVELLQTFGFNNFPLTQTICDPTFILTIVLTLGLDLYNEGRYEEATLVYESVMQQGKEVLSPDDPLIIEPQLLHGRILITKGKFVEALRILQKLHYVIEKVYLDGNYNGRIDEGKELKRGMTHAGVGKFMEEQDLCKEELQKARKVLHAGYIREYLFLLMFSIFTKEGNYEKALEISHEIQSLLERTRGDDELTKNSIKNEISRELSVLRKREKASKLKSSWWCNFL